MNLYSTILQDRTDGPTQDDLIPDPPKARGPVVRVDGYIVHPAPPVEDRCF